MPHTQRVRRRPRLSRRLTQLLQVPLQPLHQYQQFTTSNLKRPHLTILLPVIGARRVSSEVHSPVLLQYPRMLIPRPRDSLLLHYRTSSTFRGADRAKPMPFTLVPSRTPLHVAHSGGIERITSRNSHRAGSVVAVAHENCVSNHGNSFIGAPIVLGVSAWGGGRRTPGPYQAPSRLSRSLCQYVAPEVVCIVT